MTATDTRTGPSWLNIEAIVPASLIEEANRLADRLEALEPDMYAVARAAHNVVGDVEAHVDRAAEALIEVGRTADPDMDEADVSDGIHQVLWSVSGIGRLGAVQRRIADRLKEAHEARDEPGWFDEIGTVSR